MLSVKLDGNGKVTVIEVPRPEPGPGQVLIRTRVSALCGSELKAYRGNGAAQGNPGHEGMGTVAAVGAGVTKVRVGDRVGVSAIAGCGAPDCPQCQRGESTWCPKRRFFGSMHAEYFVTSENGCLLLPADVPDEVGVLVAGDGLGVPYHTSRKIAGPEVQNVAMFGLGPIGLGNVLLQAHLGRRVLAVDPVEARRRFASELGAAAVVDPAAQDAVEAIKGLTGGGGADVAIEAAGVPATVKACFRSVRTAGTVVFNGEQPAVEISPSEDLIRRDIHAVGAWFFQVGEFPAMVELFRRGLRVRALVSHVFPLRQAADAYAVFAGGGAAKVLLDMRSE